MKVILILFYKSQHKSEGETIKLCEKMLSMKIKIYYVCRYFSILDLEENLKDKTIETKKRRKIILIYSKPNLTGKSTHKLLIHLWMWSKKRSWKLETSPIEILNVRRSIRETWFCASGKYFPIVYKRPAFKIAGVFLLLLFENRIIKETKL